VIVARLISASQCLLQRVRVWCCDARLRFVRSVGVVAMHVWVCLCASSSLLCACGSKGSVRAVLCLSRSCCVVRPMLRVCLFAFGFAAHHVGAAPVVNLRLSPPQAQLPEVSAEIDGLDASREAAEAAGLRRLDAAFEEAVRDAEVRIKGVVANAVPVSAPGVRTPVALLGASRKRVGSQGGFLLHVLPASPVSNAVLKKVAVVERVRNAEEQMLIDQGVHELGLLVDVVVARLQAALRARGAAFLGSGVAGEPAIDVRLLPPAEPFATVAGLVSEMEGRRDAAEDQLRKHIVELELKLLQRMSGMVAAASG